MTTLLDQVREIVGKSLGVEVEAVTPEASLADDLGADSLAVIETVMALEDDLGVKFPEDGLADIKTVADIVAFLEKSAEKPAEA